MDAGHAGAHADGDDREERGDRVGHAPHKQLWTRRGSLPARSQPGVCKHAAAQGRGPVPQQAPVSIVGGEGTENLEPEVRTS